MIHKKKFTGRPIWSICLVWLLAMCLCPSCNSGQAQSNMQDGSMAAGSSAESPEETVPDTEGPVISGVQALTTSIGETFSYRTGVTATDDQDGTVMLLVDSSAVNLSVPGEYQIIYSAEDSSGNRTEITTTVVVTEPEPDPVPEASGAESGNSGGQASALSKEASLEKVIDKADQILAKITKDGMSKRETAKAIFDYVAKNVKYVGSSDKSSWIVGAYVGMTTGRGDCFNYYACSKALLTRAGIPIVELQRVNGNSRHYWVLADVGEGYHHFDPCPHPKGYPLTCFLLTEAEVRQYTANLAAHSSYYINYYTYDYSSCPVTVAGMPTDEAASLEQATKPAPSEPANTTETSQPEPDASDTTETPQPEIPDPADPETPSEPTGETTDEPSNSDGAAQDESTEASADMPLDEAEDSTDNIEAWPEGEEE